MSGAVFYRGACVTVFDLAWKMSGRAHERGRSSRIVVLERPRWAGFRVDRVLGLTRSLGEAGAEAPVGWDRAFLRGTVEWNGRAVGILDIDRLMVSEQTNARSGRPAGVPVSTVPPDAGD